ncbi:hypothetical protein H5410_004093 [Solanum commersonii]|uniref:Uncharacterized protein n=1 Tax=Solanum commersonii TaxID=4109 RepID=A0A9J6B6S4_SOLCO|nr:hypothetical protein H5410_004093 [Solanum commersonii]
MILADIYRSFDPPVKGNASSRMQHTASTMDSRTSLPTSYYGAGSFQIGALHYKSFQKGGEIRVLAGYERFCVRVDREVPFPGLAQKIWDGCLVIGIGTMSRLIQQQAEFEEERAKATRRETLLRDKLIRTIREHKS